jgi:hypothetical protein
MGHLERMPNGTYRGGRPGVLAIFIVLKVEVRQLARLYLKVLSSKVLHLNILLDNIYYLFIP